VRHTLVDPENEDYWALEGVVDLSGPEAFEGPLISLRSIGEG
jgi:hypothetical protein